MPLFVSPFESFWNDFTMCLFAAATGDMIFMLILYVTVAIIHRNVYWLSDRAAYRQPATWVVPMLIGGLLAISFELWAVYVVERWHYGIMPLVPILKVGITPLLQMIIIPPATIAICRWTHLRAQP